MGRDGNSQWRTQGSIFFADDFAGAGALEVELGVGAGFVTAPPCCVPAPTAGFTSAFTAVSFGNGALECVKTMALTVTYGAASCCTCTGAVRIKPNGRFSPATNGRTGRLKSVNSSGVVTTGCFSRYAAFRFFPLPSYHVTAICTPSSARSPAFVIDPNIAGTRSSDMRIATSSSTTFFASY